MSPLSFAALSHSVMSNSLPPRDYSLPGSSIHGDSPGKNIGGGGQALLQGVFPTLGSNSGLPQSRQILYQLSYQGNPMNPLRRSKGNLRLELQAQ